MKIIKGYKTELDPNNKQRTAFLRHAGAARFIYNWALADRIERHERGEKTNMYEQKKRFNALKHEQFPWLHQVAYAVVENAFRNLDTAYTNFFRRIKNGDAKKGFPKFKSRKNGIGSFTLRGCIHSVSGGIKLPRIGWVRLKEHDYIPADGIKILSVNISEKARRWYASVQCEQDIADVTATGPVIGVDLGIKSLAICSNGRVFENPKALQYYEKKLRRLQRQLSRRQKGGKNYAKTKQAIAKLHVKIANIRRDAIHKVTHYLTATTKPSVVVIEDLNVSGMLKNHSLAKAIADASFAEFRRQLEYKAHWYGVDLLIADRFYPSSKTCSECGNVKPLLRLSERTFVCEKCGVVIDRDFNASVNLANLAVKPTVTACGDDKVTAESLAVVVSEAGSEQRNYA